jgi:phage-related protein
MRYYEVILRVTELKEDKNITLLGYKVEIEAADNIYSIARNIAMEFYAGDILRSWRRGSNTVIFSYYSEFSNRDDFAEIQFFTEEISEEKFKTLKMKEYKIFRWSYPPRFVSY